MTISWVDERRAKRLPFAVTIAARSQRQHGHLHLFFAEFDILNLQPEGDDIDWINLSQPIDAPWLLFAKVMTGMMVVQGALQIIVALADGFVPQPA